MASPLEYDPSCGPADCFWHGTVQSRPRSETLNGTFDVDVAIVGGGYTGLSTAYHLLNDEPGLRVAVLEAERIGFGASGRNAGFVMTLFGSSLPLMKLLHGAERVRIAHDYMVSAISMLESTIQDNSLDCDFRRNGFLKVATSPAYASRIRDEVDVMQSIGISGVDWINQDAVGDRVGGQNYLGALWEPGAGSLNPVKWLFGLADLVQKRGAHLFEMARVASVKRVGGRYCLTTPGGTVTARKIVYATNGYSHLVPGLALSQFPAFTYVIVSEQLTEKQLNALRWPGREGIEDGLNFMHYYRLTPDSRLLVGGGPGVLPFGRRMKHDTYPHAWRHLERFIHQTFPQLGEIAIEYKWGGAFSMTPDCTPQIGTLRRGDAVYSVGCTGHGVAMTHANGAILRDLVLERETALTDLWFVNRRSLPTPPEPLRSAATQCVSRFMALDDWWCGRG